MMEVVETQIMIVGALSDISEVYEIESIAKIFVVEERMKNLTIQRIDECRTTEKPEQRFASKKHDTYRYDVYIHRHIPVLTVKGLK